MVNFYRESLIDTIVAPDGSTLVIDNPQANATDEPFPAFDTQKDLPNIDKIYKDGGSSKRRMRPLSPRERRKRQVTWNFLQTRASDRMLAIPLG